MWDIIIRGAVNGALFALIAAGLNLQYGITRILNVAHGEFILLGALITAALFNLYNVNPLVSLVISGCTVFLLGLSIYMLIFRKIVRESKIAEELEVRSLLACFGLLVIIPNVINIIVSKNRLLMAYTVNWLRDPISMLGVRIELNRIVALFIAIIFSVILYVILRFTRTGLALKATAQEPTGAQLVGINISRYHLISFGISALLASVGGSLLSMIFYNLTSAYSAGFTFIALTIIVLGGVGSFIGSLIGGFIMGYIYYIVSTQELQLAMPIIYIFLLILLLIRPKGLFGR